MPSAAKPEASAAEKVEIPVILMRELFASARDDRPFAVWVVKDAKTNQEFKASAELSSWGRPGDEVLLSGTWVQHPKYGQQFSVQGIMLNLPADLGGFARWLSTQHGVGPVTAKKIAALIGDGKPIASVDALVHNPAPIEQIPGLTSVQRVAAVEAVKKFREHRNQNKIISWCYSNGMGPAHASRVWNVLHGKAIEVLQEDPWRLSDLDGFGFLTADDLARRLSVPAISARRMRSAIIYALEQASTDGGHVFLTKPACISTALKLMREIAEKSGYGRGFGEKILAGLNAALEKLIAEGEVTLDGNNVYLPNLAEDEALVRRWLSDAKNKSGMLTEGQAKAIAENSDVRGPLDDVQLSAVVQALSRRASILTGGPGTGKTATTKAVIAGALLALQKAMANPEQDEAPKSASEELKSFNSEFDEIDDDLEADSAKGPSVEEMILLAAPTGRASKRMEEVTGFPSLTIHRLLEYNPRENGFGRNREFPLYGRLLIVDEMSMSDISLTAALLDAVPPSMSVLFVGDVDQLPPVGPGAPFHEFVRKGLLPTVKLEHIYRQDKGSPIPHNAKLINSGQPPVTIANNDSYRHFVFDRAPAHLSKPEKMRIGQETRAKMAQSVVKWAKTLLEEGFKPDDIQVLTPTRRGPIGVSSLNELLHPILNPAGSMIGTFSSGGREFWMGDRVMQLRNDYQKGVFNGEIGKVVAVDVYKSESIGENASRGMDVEKEFEHLAPVEAERMVAVFSKYQEIHAEIESGDKMQRFAASKDAIRQGVSLRALLTLIMQVEGIDEGAGRVKVREAFDQVQKEAEDLAKSQDEKRGIVVEFDDGHSKRVAHYIPGDLSDITLAYAATVHKAQGGEYPAVIMAIGWDSYMLLKRNLVYTAITRAREKIVVVAEDGAIEHAVRQVDDSQRNQKLVG